jgi:hypothetical protein
VALASEWNTEWRRYPEGAAYVTRLLESFTAAVPPAAVLEHDLLRFTSSRLLDWLDHLVLVDGEGVRGRLVELGFEAVEVTPLDREPVYQCRGAIFPSLVLRSDPVLRPGAVAAAAIQVEDVSEFLMANYRVATIEGSALSPYRRARAWSVDGRDLWVVERRGHVGFSPVNMSSEYPDRYVRALETWRTRRREFDEVQEGMVHTLELARRLVSDMGTDLAAWIAFSAEREHWQRRNMAGALQKARQDRLGLGWANHDHHTFRSSREGFPLLIEILETFGFVPRERFYAGAEAGWGAQVMEQPACRFAVFADVDLAPDEVDDDFAHQALSPRTELGTVGLWCALHGESMLAAGLHHVAGRFDFDAVTAALAEWGVPMMQPFSEFSYLRQAFTRGERWPIPDQRLERLVALNRIGREQAERFREAGAVGSHLENIQRGDGFKGFNQQTISDIIQRTDPRVEPSAA